MADNATESKKRKQRGSPKNEQAQNPSETRTDASDKKSNKERLKEITDSIEKGIRELFESDKYKQYLVTMSRFHKYSVNNTMLIYMQRPDATRVAGYNAWRDRFGRTVKRGEKGIKIIAPTPYKKKIEQEKLDPDTNLPMRDKDGNIIMEEKTIKIPTYKPVSVFDLSQTYGKPLPQLAESLTGDIKNFDVFEEALRRSSPVPFSYKEMADGTDGYFDLDAQAIAIRMGMSEVQTVSAIIHEMAHATLHNNVDNSEKLDNVEIFGRPALFSNESINPETLPEGLHCYDLRGSDNDPGMPVTLENYVSVNHAGSIITAEPIEIPETGYIQLNDSLNFTGDAAKTIKEFFAEHYPEKAKISRNTEEVQAESISYAVCAYYGIKTGENSFGYIAGWSKDKDLPELRASLETISRTSSQLISDIDKNYREIVKEHETEIAPSEQQAEKEKASEPETEQAEKEKASEPETEQTETEKAPEPETEQTEAAKSETKQEVSVKHGTGQSAYSIEPPTEQPETGKALENIPVPDPAVSVESMYAYGYTDENMLPLTKDRAIELWEDDAAVYLLYSDNTESMALDKSELQEHDGLFGIDRYDWEAFMDGLDAAQSELPVQKDFEKLFAECPQDAYIVYQLTNSPDNAKRLYMNYEYLEKNNLPIERSGYEAIYAAPLNIQGSTAERLDSLYEILNVNHPADYRGHSLSVSDIVALKQDGVISSHYVDSMGFRALPDFVKPENYLKAAEISTEDDYGMIDGIINNGERKPTAAELEADVKAGKSISLSELAEALKREKAEQAEARMSAKAERKPSVLAKLHANTERQTKKTAPHKSAEMEI